MCLRCFALTCKLKWDLDYNCSFIQRLPPRNRSSCNLNIISDTRLPLLPEYKDTEWAHPGAGSTLWKPILNLYNTVWQPRLNLYSNCKKTDTDIFPFGPHWILQDKCSDKNISCHLRKLSWTHSWQGRFNPNRHELIHKKGIQFAITWAIVSITSSYRTTLIPEIRTISVIAIHSQPLQYGEKVYNGMICMKDIWCMR